MAMSLLRGASLVAYGFAQILLLVYASHRYVILWRWWRARSGGTAAAGRGGIGGADARPEDAPAAWPAVTVQLPLYNERFVAERLIDAAAALDYPADRLEIQVLDDSTDDTAERVARIVARHRQRGVDILHVRRSARGGYKAGALAHGAARARGSLFAVFDADFLPPRDFLRRLVGHFADPSVGMVQARWTHLNRGHSRLTAAQAVMLDAHFLLEHFARMSRGLFFNFNGTAGIWRRECLADAGGWSHDTLTEDLDLSYRAQLRGWRFVFDGDVAAPGELPADIEALKSQQRRWAKGSIQTARKLLPAVFRSRLPVGLKLEAFFHLTSNTAYALLLALGLLLCPVLLWIPTTTPWVEAVAQAVVVVFGVVPVVLFLVVGHRVAGGGTRAVMRDVPAAILLGVGLSLNNSRAVLEGFGRRVGEWQRTPKSGASTRRIARIRGYSAAEPRAGTGELALALFFAGLAVFAWRHEYLRAIPFAVLLAAGFATVGVASWKARLESHGGSPAAEPAAGSRAPGEPRGACRGPGRCGPSFRAV